MASINAEQEQEITFLSGINAQGRVAAVSFWTWNQQDPAQYRTYSYESKWGATQAGLGGTVTIAFDPASNWSTVEQAAFTAAMHLWSAEANITFNIVGSGQGEDVTITRGTDGKAQGGITSLDDYSNPGSARLGAAEGGEVTIDTSIRGFGPIGSAFSVYGGYPWSTVLHELGHVLGLGHGGAYNDGTTDNSPQFTQYDNTAYSLMSYNDAPDYNSAFAWGTSGGYGRSPVTPMMLDIAAAERIYGAPVGGPLSGGQVFGFNTNISGDIAQFFDFTINTKPVITLFDTGLNNTFDASGFANAAVINLNQGYLSSVAGLSNNVGIAFGTRIDTAITGSGNDQIYGNDDGNVLMGGGGADTVNAGAGNDHIYGNMLSSTQGASDGADVINAGDGSNYVNGNAGNDTITAGTGSNRLYGGQGNDTIHVTGNGNNHVNGNLGDDLLIADAGNNDLHGGQGNDTIQPTGGNNQSFGELGNDVIWVASGFDKMTGGAGNDLFVLSGPANAAPTFADEIVDFTSGADKLHMEAGGALPLVLHSTGSFVDQASAAQYAQAAFGASTGEAAALQVGNDTYLFYTVAAGTDAVVKLDGINAALIDQNDFVLGTTHL